MTKPLLPQRAKYIGKSGPMGLKRGEIYVVEVFMRTGTITGQPIICVSKSGERNYYVPYKTMKKFQLQK